MRCNQSLLTLSSMAMKLTPTTGGEALSDDTELDDLFHQAKGMAVGSRRGGFRTTALPHQVRPAQKNRPRQRAPWRPSAETAS